MTGKQCTKQSDDEIYWCSSGAAAAAAAASGRTKSRKIIITCRVLQITTYTWPKRVQVIDRPRNASLVSLLWAMALCISQKIRSRKWEIQLRNSYGKEHLINMGNHIAVWMQRIFWVQNAMLNSQFTMNMRWSHKVWHCSFPSIQCFVYVLARVHKMEKQLKPERTRRKKNTKKPNCKETETTTTTIASAKQCARQHTKRQMRGKKRNKEWCILCVANEIYGSSEYAAAPHRNRTQRQRIELKQHTQQQRISHLQCAGPLTSGH